MAIKKVGMTIKKVAMTGLLLLMGFEAKAQCVMNQDCASLGYTKTASECSGQNGLKCPFGNSWSCQAKEQDRKCQIGWIYYSDNTCSANVVSGKIALGVVVYLNPYGIGGQVMAAKSIGNYKWDNYENDIQSLPNYTNYQTAMKDYDSCGNTDKITAGSKSHSGGYPAAWAARNYTPTVETSGKWCLPAAGILSSVYVNVSLVNVGIAKLGGTKMPALSTAYEHIWSSSEYDYHYSWFYCTYDGWSQAGLHHAHNGTNKDTSNSVRPVMEF